MYKWYAVPIITAHLIPDRCMYTVCTFTLFIVIQNKEKIVYYIYMYVGMPFFNTLIIFQFGCAQ